MIINIWSTPRTGSVWLMHHLKAQYNRPHTLLIAAPFEPWQNSTYRIVLPDGRDKFIPHYQSGAFFQDFYFDGQGILRSRLNYCQRVRTPGQEAEHNLKLLKKVKSDQIVIVNNHVPIEKNYFDRMLTLASRNIWIDRKNKKDQLASWAISMHSGTFTYFDRSHVFSDQVDIFDKKLLVDLVKRIKVWEKCDKTGHEVLSFEDLELYSGPGFPVDGNTNSWSRLGQQIKDDIMDLVLEYESQNI